MQLLALALALASADPIVTVVLADGKRVVVDEAAWAVLAKESATATEKDKSEHVFAGVSLSALLAAQGVPLGEKLSGEALATVVVLEARDGYKVAFGLSDVDPATSGRTMVLARSMDGKPLSEKKAPLQLIIPGDKRQARWVRQVTTIRVVKLP